MDQLKIPIHNSHDPVSDFIFIRQNPNKESIYLLLMPALGAKPATRTRDYQGRKKVPASGQKNDINWGRIERSSAFWLVTGYQGQPG